MAMEAGEIERLIQAGIPDAEVTIRDLAGDGDHYAATVVAASFRGKSRVQQHQMVYQALKGEMGGELHALALQTGTPEALKLLKFCRSRGLGCASGLRYIYEPSADSAAEPGARKRGHSWRSSSSSTTK